MGKVKFKEKGDRCDEYKWVKGLLSSPSWVPFMYLHPFPSNACPKKTIITVKSRGLFASLES